jgi:hypothetical protein
MIIFLSLLAASTESAEFNIAVNMSAIVSLLRFFPHQVGFDAEHPWYTSDNDYYKHKG